MLPLTTCAAAMKRAQSGGQGAASPRLRGLEADIEISLLYQLGEMR